MLENTTDSSESGRFQLQNWPVYQKALEFVINAGALCNCLPRDSATGLRDQLRRASQSIPLNIAEGCSRYGKRDKANFWRVARGSVFECVAILDIIQMGKLVSEPLGDRFKELTTLGRMLSGLIGYIEKNGK